MSVAVYSLTSRNTYSGPVGFHPLGVTCADTSRPSNAIKGGGPPGRWSLLPPMPVPAILGLVLGLRPTVPLASGPAGGRVSPLAPATLSRTSVQLCAQADAAAAWLAQHAAQAAAASADPAPDTGGWSPASDPLPPTPPLSPYEAYLASRGEARPEAAPAAPEVSAPPPASPPLSPYEAYQAWRQGAAAPAPATTPPAPEWPLLDSTNRGTQTIERACLPLK